MPKQKSKRQEQPKAPMTRRQQSRWAREQRQQRIALGFVIATVVLVIGILFFGIWREILSRPGQAVARVGARSLTLGSLAEEITYRANLLDRQIELAQRQVLEARSAAANDPTLSFLSQYAEQQLQQLQLQRFQISDGQGMVEELIQRELIKQEATKRGIAVTTGDIDAEIVRQFQPQPSSSDIDATTAATDTVALPPAPSPTPIPPDAWRANYQQTLTQYGLSEANFRRFTIEPLVWRTRLEEILTANVPTTTEQVRARHILLPTQADAADVLALLREAPNSFADIAKVRSTDESNKDEGGDLGWFGRGVMAPEFEVAAFTTAAGQITGVISTTFGFHIIKVEERDANRPLTESELANSKAQAFNEWLQTAILSADVTRYFDSDKQNWLNKQIPAMRF